MGRSRSEKRTFKLRLRKETIRTLEAPQLSEAELAQVIGGWTDWTPKPSCECTAAGDR
jgi:bacteriocin-like protein